MKNEFTPSGALATGGPYFDACWKVRGEWMSEKFRLFTRARDRCQEELKAGAEMAYVKHIITEEAVWSANRGQ